MIRRAENADFPAAPTDEASLRILSLREAYGTGTDFLHFFTDGEGTLMSLLDGAAVLAAPGGAMSEEWMEFLSFYTAVRTVRTDAANAGQIARRWETVCETGEVLRYGAALPDPDTLPTVVSDPAPDKLYPLLRDCFPEEHLPPFDAWYVDVSHRMRHGCCHICAVQQNGQFVSTAMTVAMASRRALIGYVATDPAWRRRGYALGCILSLIRQGTADDWYIAPVDDHAAGIYKRGGFVSHGTWGEVSRAGN